MSSVLALRLDDQEDPFHLGLIAQNVIQRSLDDLLAGLDSAPSVRTDPPDRGVELQCEIQHRISGSRVLAWRFGYAIRARRRPSGLLQVVVERPERGTAFQLLGRILRQPCLYPPRQVRYALQV